MKKIEAMTAAEAKARLKELEAEGEENRARMREISPDPIDAHPVTQEAIRGPAYEKALAEGRDADVVELQEEYRRRSATGERITFQRRRLKERAKVAAAEEARASAPRDLAKAIAAFEKLGPEALDLRMKADAAERELRSFGYSIRDLRKLVGLDEAPGVSPAALRTFWALTQPHTPDGAVQVWGESLPGTPAMRAALIADARNLLPAPAPKTVKALIAADPPRSGASTLDVEAAEKRARSTIYEARVKAIAAGAGHLIGSRRERELVTS